MVGRRRPGHRGRARLHPGPPGRPRQGGLRPHHALAPGRPRRGGLEPGARPSRLRASHRGRPGPRHRCPLPPHVARVPPRAPAPRPPRRHRRRLPHRDGGRRFALPRPLAGPGPGAGMGGADDPDPCPDRPRRARPEPSLAQRRHRRGGRGAGGRRQLDRRGLARPRRRPALLDLPDQLGPHVRRRRRRHLARHLRPPPPGARGAAARPVHAAGEAGRGRHGCGLPRAARHVAAPHRGQAPAPGQGGHAQPGALRARGAAHRAPEPPQHRLRVRLRADAGRHAVLRDGVPGGDRPGDARARVRAAGPGARRARPAPGGGLAGRGARHRPRPSRRQARQRPPLPARGRRRRGQGRRLRPGQGPGGLLRRVTHAGQRHHGHAALPGPGSHHRSRPPRCARGPLRAGRGRLLPPGRRPRLRGGDAGRGVQPSPPHAARPALAAPRAAAAPRPGVGDPLLPREGPVTAPAVRGGGVDAPRDVRGRGRVG